jgi:hypothetical protein
VVLLSALVSVIAGCGQGMSGSSYVCDTGHGLTLRLEFKSSGKLLETRTLAGVSIHRESEYREGPGEVTFGAGTRAVVRGSELVISGSGGSLTCQKE